MRRIAVILISIVVSALLLWLALRNLPLADVVESVAQANIWMVLLSLVLVVLGLWMRGIRWRGMVGNRVNTLDAFFIMGITMMLNVMPLRPGELARSLLATRHKIPFMTAATSIVVERLLDTFLAVFMLLVSISQLPEAPPEVTGTTRFFAIAAIAGFALLIFFANRPGIPHRLLEQVERWVPPLKRLHLVNLVDHVLDGLEPLTHWRSFSHAVGWTLIAWGFSLAGFWAMYQSMNIDYPQLWLAIVLSIALASFSIAIPVTLVGLGAFQAAFAITGGLTGINQTNAIALSFVVQGVSIAGYMLCGGLGVLAMGVSLGDLFAQADTPPATAEANALSDES